MDKLRNLLNAAAQAIRKKTGDDGSIRPSELSAKIAEIAVDHNYAADGVLTGTIKYAHTSATKIKDYAFTNCQELKFVSAPFCEAIGDNAFKYCYNLKAVPALSSCNSIGSSAFYSCQNIDLSAIQLSPDISFIGSYAFTNAGESNSTRLDLTGKLLNCEFIGSYAFGNVKINLENGYLNLQKIGIFNNVFGDWNAEGIKKMSMQNCTDI